LVGHPSNRYDITIVDFFWWVRVLLTHEFILQAEIHAKNLTAMCETELPILRSIIAPPIQRQMAVVVQEMHIELAEMRAGQLGMLIP
jgi:hypothetical protein